MEYGEHTTLLLTTAMASQLETSLPPYVLPKESTPPPAQQGLGLANSIWAPQPSESHWPKAIDSLTRQAESQPLISREDAFSLRPRDVGAIGDGRAKKFSSGFDDSHVDQLLRTLNINSPPGVTSYSKYAALEQQPYSPNVSDFSPASASSALLTPSDLSPAIPGRSFAGDFLKYHGAFDPLAPLPASQLPTSDALYHAQQPSFYHNHQQHQHHSHQPLASSAPPPPIQSTAGGYPFYEPFIEQTSPVAPSHLPFSSSPTTPGKHHHPQQQQHQLYSSSTPPRRFEGSHRTPLGDLTFPQLPLPPLQPSPEWARCEDKLTASAMGLPSAPETPPRSIYGLNQHSPGQGSPTASHEPINFLSLLHPSSSPPYPVFVSRIIKSSDQQASIFLQQKLKVADMAERAKIVDAICARGFEMMAHRFGNWAVQRCLEAASSIEERRKIVGCMRGRIVDLATNCYGCHVLQKALDCEEDIRLLIVSELLRGDPAQTLVNKHASHVWSKIMELSWTPPAPPIFAYVNNSLKGKWAALACHETGSLVVQHAFENLEDHAKDGIVDELLSGGPAVFAEVCKNQWGSYCIQHILEHGSEKHRQMTLDHLLNGLLEFSANEQGAKSVTKALKEGGAEVLARFVKRMCEPARGARRPMIVDMALSVTGSQFIATVLPSSDKDQRAMLYDCIRGHIVTLRGCKTGSKVIWLFDRMRAYYGY
ncbi:armadillo-type protein [Flagelloscypha sp. PMI_526]|nr:armadillo-type protein [Flagelloscypha sp. PMI_526]